MTNDQAQTIINLLSDMNKKLEAIDWKLWEFHNKLSQEEEAKASKKKPVKAKKDEQ
jgi:hypothetical protein